MKHVIQRSLALVALQFCFGSVVHAEPMISSGDVLLFPIRLFLGLPTLWPQTALVIALIWGAILGILIVSGTHLQLRSSMGAKITSVLLGIVLLSWIYEGLQQIQRLNGSIFVLMRIGYAADVFAVGASLLVGALLLYVFLASPKKVR